MKRLVLMIFLKKRICQGCRKIYQSFINLSLKYKLLVSFLLIGIIPLIFAGYLFYGESYDVILDNAEQYTMEMLTQIDRNITSKVQYVDNLALTIITNKSMKSLLNESDEVNRGRNIRQVDTYLRNILIGSRDISDILIVDRNGTRYGIENGYFDSNIDFKKSIYYTEALKGNGNNIWLGMKENLVKMSYERPTVLPSVSVIKDFYNDIYEGILIINLRQDVLVDILGNLYESKEDNVLLLDRDKNMMLSTKPLDMDFNTLGFEHIIDDNGTFIEDITGRPTLITYHRNSKTGWYLMSTIPVDDLISNSKIIKSAIFDIVIIFILLCIIFAFLISSSMVKGFDQLIDMMDYVQRGNLNIHLNSNRQDELGQLSNSFDAMIGQLDTLIEKNYEQKIQADRAQLKALQAQISPHFLYNALDSINWMLIEKEEWDISEVVIALSDLLRYSISNNNDMVSVGEEIKNIENYLTIQKVRFENRFSYKIEVDSTIKDKLIPKLLIQPIVENAVVHGIEEKVEGGIIAINGYYTEGITCFEIIDNGPGIAKEKIDMLMDNDKSSHLGLNNVNRRIKLIYGSDYGIIIDNRPNEEGVIVRVILPESL